MAVKKVSKVRRPTQEEPENPYTSGGPSAGRGNTGASGAGQGSGSSRGTANRPLAFNKDYFPEDQAYGHRSNPRYSNPAYLQYLPTRPGYLKYFEEDVSAPLIAGRGNPGLIAELQRQLAAAGLITGRVPRGVWDPKTEKGYRRLLQMSNVWGMSDRATLDRLLAESEGVVVDDTGGNVGRRTSDGSGEGGRGTGFRIENGEFVPEGPESFVPPPLELRLPNPDDVKRVIRRGSIDMLGQALDNDNIQSITDAYMNEVTGRQREAYNQMVERERQIWETGTSDIQEITTVEAPSAETFAEQRLQAEHGAELQKNKGMELLLNLVGQWGR